MVPPYHVAKTKQLHRSKKQDMAISQLGPDAQLGIRQFYRL
jgi:hypothetical protein